MRTLTSTEKEAIAGGRIQATVPGNNGGRSGNGAANGSTNSGSSDRGKLGISGLGPYRRDSSLLNAEINQVLAEGYDIEYGTIYTGGSGTEYTSHGGTLRIHKYDNGNMPDVVSQLLHELGHALHPTDPISDYPSEAAWESSELLGEGYAQLNAIRGVQQLNAHGFDLQIPGAHEDITQQEQDTYDRMSREGKSDADIAKALGEIIKNDTVEHGQTYDDELHFDWNVYQSELDNLRSGGKGLNPGAPGIGGNAYG